MGILGGAVQAPSAIPFDPLIPHTSLDGSNESDDMVYRSEPALKLTSQIAPTLSAKLRSLASAIDAELVEKDAELAEAQRVVNMRQAEIEHLQRQADELRVQELEQTAGGTESDEDLQAQLKTVEAECIAVLEAEQRRNLDALYQSPISDIPSGPPDDSLDEEALLHVQLKYAREFMTMIDGRKELVQEVAGNLARAGIGGGNSQQYKRLITGALRVREEELEGLLPEIVEELEMGRGLEGIGV
jgi:hypothetical protein